MTTRRNRLVQRIRVHIVIRNSGTNHSHDDSSYIFSLGAPVFYVTRTRVRSVGHDTYLSVGLGNYENWGHGDTVLFLDTGTGTRRIILINKYGKLDILTKINNKTQIRHDFVVDLAN